MWGLDGADPRVAIAAMQSMNCVVRNAVFLPAFFLTPLVMAGSAALYLREKRPRSAVLMATAAAVLLFGGLVLTMTVNVPMNEALAGVIVPVGIAEAGRIWTEYS